MLDPSGRVATWNAGAERIKGYKADEIIGKHFSIFYPPEDVAAGQARARARGRRPARAASRTKAGASARTARGSGRTSSSPRCAIRDGTLVGFAKVTRDLTERREAEEIATRAGGPERRARGEGPHPRVPGALPGYFGTRSAQSARDRSTWERDSCASDRPIPATRANPRPDARQLSADVSHDRADPRSHARASRWRPGIEARTAGHRGDARSDRRRAAHGTSGRDDRGALLALRSNGTADRLEQVFSNLIGNAIVYGEPSKPVSVEGRREGRQVSIVVHNYGKPIPGELQAILFDPFRRGQRDSQSPKTEGFVSPFTFE